MWSAVLAARERRGKRRRPERKYKKLESGSIVFAIDTGLGEVLASSFSCYSGFISFNATTTTTKILRFKKIRH